MNSLSWLIYLAEVAGKIHYVSGFGMVMILIGGGLALFMSPPTCDFNKERMLSFCRSVIIWCGSILMFLGSIYVFTPSSRTIYMIAASEIGEKVVTSPDAVEMLDDLKIIIKNRLKEEVEEKKK